LKLIGTENEFTTKGTKDTKITPSLTRLSKITKGAHHVILSKAKNLMFLIRCA